SGLFIFHDHLFVLFFMIILTSILLTEVISNTTVVLVTFPIIAGLSVSGGFNPFFLMLAVAVASNGAFMSPIATSVNAVSYAGLPGVSLKKMLQRGLILNLCTAAYFSLVFFLFNRIF
ncbi:MAG: sodium:sulfate symporter, partial [Candidatus Aminicenantaceae bacterium]